MELGRKHPEHATLPGVFLLLPGKNFEKRPIDASLFQNSPFRLPPILPPFCYSSKETEWAASVLAKLHHQRWLAEQRNVLHDARQPGLSLVLHGSGDLPV